MNLNIAKITKFTQSFWKQLGVFVAKWIRADAEKGIFQNDKRNDYYRSKGYKAYKLRDMRTADGKRLKSYFGKRISSNETSFVNMTLTGDLLRYLAPKTATDDSVSVAFRMQDYWKVKGNERFGRLLLGLREENKQKVAKMIGAEIAENIKKNLTKRIEGEININL